MACHVFGAAAVTAADGPRAVRRRLAETAALNERSFEVRKITWGNSVEISSTVMVIVMVIGNIIQIMVNHGYMMLYDGYYDGKHTKNYSG